MRLAARAALMLLVPVLAAAVAAAELTPAALRGKQIYVHGTSAGGGEISALVGAGSVRLPASVTPCASCHGEDGRGRAESGVVPSDIRWARLTKPYGSVAPDGRRRHPAYDEATLRRAITAGLDPADNRLDPAMPRFQMTRGDLDDLVAYLEALEGDLDPGLGEARIVLGTVLPRPQGPDSLGAAVAALLDAFFDDLNQRGGIHGRRIELVVEHADSPDDAVARARALADGEQVFALVAAFTGGVDEAIAEVVEGAGMPLVGPLARRVPGDAGTRRYTFYLLAGEEVQGRALVAFAKARLAQARVSLVHAADPEARAVARAMSAEAEQVGWAPPLALEYPAGDMDPGALAAELATAGVEALFFVGRGSELGLLAGALDRRGLRPAVFVAGPRAGAQALALPPGFAERVFVAFPASPGDVTPAGRRELEELRRRHDLGARHAAAQLSAYAAAKLLVEGLSRAGRALSRDKLVLALEGVYEFTTGLTRPLSYAPDRRVGVEGAHVVAVDVANHRFAASSTWVQTE